MLLRFSPRWAGVRHPRSSLRRTVSCSHRVRAQSRPQAVSWAQPPPAVSAALSRRCVWRWCFWPCARSGGGVSRTPVYSSAPSVAPWRRRLEAGGGGRVGWKKRLRWQRASLRHRGHVGGCEGWTWALACGWCTNSHVYRTNNKQKGGVPSMVHIFLIRIKWCFMVAYLNAHPGING